MIDTDKYENEGHIDYQKLIARMGKEKKILEGQNKDLLAEVERLRKMMDVLASFNIVKNAEQGFTQREWVELVELVKRGEEE